MEWDRKISSPDNPNFWKYGTANLIFLDCVGGKKLVLDLGCGTGSSTFFLANEGQAERIVGVDLVKDMIKLAKRKAACMELERRICFVLCDGRSLPFRASCFDGLISRGDAFCFLIPLESAVQELKRVVKPGGVMVLEMDNRVDWEPGSTISAGFLKTCEEEIAFVLEEFTARRDHKAVSYILDQHGKIANQISRDPEFQEKGFKEWDYPLQEIEKETIEVRHGLPTHWPTAKELHALFKRSGFTDIELFGDGLLMKLWLEGVKSIVDAMRNNPQLFFEIERRLVQYVDPKMAPTIILRATLPPSES